MKRDSLFFELFRDLPRGFFEAIGRSDVDPRQYELKSIEYKESAVRLDGVFLPRTPAAGPAYVWEAQCSRSNTVYANLISKIGRFLEHGDPSQEWVAVVIYPTRSLEQKNLGPYRCLLNSDQMVRVYLDELASSETDGLELGILGLIAVGPDEALRKARQLVPRVRAAKLSTDFRRRVIQFIEIVILYQFRRCPARRSNACCKSPMSARRACFKRRNRKGSKRAFRPAASKPRLVSRRGCSASAVRSPK